MARGITALPKHLLPFPSEFSFTLHPASIDKLGQRLNNTIQSLQAAWKWKAAIATGVGFVMDNVWSRFFRRKRKAIEKQQGGDDSVATEEAKEVEDEEALLGFQIQLRYDKGSQDSVVVVVRWLKGNDSVLFESFCGMVKRTLEMRDE